jgi:hypothetical protein
MPDSTYIRLADHLREKENRTSKAFDMSDAGLEGGEINRQLSRARSRRGLTRYKQRD